ncbi:MAG: TIGR02757 family protein [Chitinophagaceae bacterium]|uniref:TIGR02757 family protein n=1 Tax=unclassified Paraflavitalea TaxID=2798305 RepID=UPI003D35835F|nr:TIGR02757 family protein [Chitinophagaceae bacterium]
MDRSELKEFLDFKVEQYNKPSFIEADPIAVPHRYTFKQDIEISGFLVATISWGNRKSIVANGHRLADLLGNSPYDFVMNHKRKDLIKLESFVHRTFNGEDLIHAVQSLQHLYKSYDDMEAVYARYQTKESLQPAITAFREAFYSTPVPYRTQKHVSDPSSGSAAKRINMFLRWMVREDAKGVDFGIWKSISPSKLSCPLDVHSGNTARALGLLKRPQSDAKSVEELDQSLRLLDATDPVKYDFALFGLGVMEKFAS